MKERGRMLGLAGILAGALLLAACGGSDADAVATGVAATQQMSELQTAAAGNGAGSAEGEGGADSTPTQTPTLESTPTPGLATLTLSEDTNCRRGPRVDYEFVTVIEAGEVVEVLKSYPDADYVVVRNPNGSGDCWLWLEYANETDFSAYELVEATQPPTPTATFTPSATATPVYTWDGSWDLYNGSMTVTLTTEQSGNSVSGEYDLIGTTYTIEGTLSADWRTLTGTWSEPGGSNGTFLFYMLENLDQARGNWDVSHDFCIARNGAALPAPCFHP